MNTTLQLFGKAITCVVITLKTEVVILDFAVRGHEIWGFVKRNNRYLTADVKTIFFFKRYFLRTRNLHQKTELENCNIL